MNDDRRGGLLRHHLHVFGQRNTKRLRLEKGEQRQMRFKIWTGRITETVAGTLIILGNGPMEVTGPHSADSHLLPHPPVPVFGQGIRDLNTQAMEQEVVMVGILLIESGGLFSDLPPDGDNKKSGDIATGLGGLK